MDKHRFIFKLSLTYGGNLNYYKSFHLPISTLPVGTGSTLAIFKINQSTLFLIEFPDKLSSFPSRRVKKERPFWKGANEVGPHWEIVPKSTWSI